VAHVHGARVGEHLGKEVDDRVAPVVHEAVGVEVGVGREHAAQLVPALRVEATPVPGLEALELGQIDEPLRVVQRLMNFAPLMIFHRDGQ